MQWYENARAAVCLTGDIDASKDIAEGRLGRMLDVLDDYKVRCTFPIVAQALQEDPEIAEQITLRKHEIAGHGDVHREFRGQSYSEQKKRLKRMIEIMETISGQRIKGFRAPFLAGDVTTIKAESNLGLLYDNTITTGQARWFHLERKLSQKNEIIRTLLKNLSKIKKMTKTPKIFYRLHPLFYVSGFESNDQPFHLNLNRKLAILLIPISDLDDYHLIDVGPRYKDWRKVAEVWKRCLSHRYERNGLYVLSAHPLRIGTKKYVKALESFIEHAISKDDVWFATLTELAEWFNKSCFPIQKTFSE